MLEVTTGGATVSTNSAKSFTTRMGFLLSLAGAIALSACGPDDPNDPEGPGDGGPEDPPGGDCGGIAGLPCPGGMFCDFPSGMCGHNDEMGTCRPIPEVCTHECVQTCGCDGRSYCNACLAHAVGIDDAPGLSCDDVPPQ
jgi:hypothetical protein